ncbi:uncharacterized protein CC84DRAFT_1165520 [Paraphaeosphaeria sporulosa]|uniref:Uncharacterized protein n=1 Tax=Paraphaeosphaeria sporulosa TaxID=1460663 RepID=A0A177CEJ7_9PLEO|nr:uncharacterized protein CC84DRAFT_1165520 [Paraphaeosphaeria sporulosa]OAG05208.1 hypothetical protein CC84DRAFT_1165520 [Paraphaeosphaeria sporulosa]
MPRPRANGFGSLSGFAPSSIASSRCPWPILRCCPSPSLAGARRTEGKRAAAGHQVHRSLAHFRALQPLERCPHKLARCDLQHAYQKTNFC